jgi:thiol-disulfide isomerase/thioredoxin
VKKYAVSFLVCCCLSLVLTSCGNKGSDPILRDINGQVFHFSALKGKWVFLNYWATWCGPCTKEIPQFNQFYEMNKQKDVTVLGVNYDKVPVNEMKVMVKKMNIRYPNLAIDPAKALGLGDIPGIPVTFLFNPQGQLIKKLYGEQTKQSLEKVLIEQKALRGI